MRRRIVVAIVGVAAGAVLLLALPLGIAAQRLYREQEVLSLERAATEGAQAFDARARSGDPVEFGASSDDIAAYSASGRLLGGAGPQTADGVVTESIASGEVTDSDHDGRLLAAVPILASERVVGAIRASRSTAALSERVLHVRLLLAAAALVIIGIALAAALALSRRLSRPVAELAEAAMRIGAGAVGVRTPRSGIEEVDVVADSLDETVAKLDDTLARERSFSADASHQLRTPLAGLRLELESAATAEGSRQRALGYVDRLERTIETLLAAARDVPAEREPFALGPLLEELRRDWTGPLAAAGRALEVAPARGLPHASASRAGVREILDVLFDNAIRHGGGTVKLGCRTIGGHLAIDVADAGPGIGDPVAAFARRTGAGHGIGLALARSLAEADGGRLDLADPRPGETTFTLLLRTADSPAT